MKRLHLLLVIMMVLMIFMFGGCWSKDEDRMLETCTPGEAIRNGEYAIINDLYNYTIYPDKYEQCIFVDRHEDIYKWVWTEITPASEETGNRVSAYIMYGCNILNAPADELDYGECLASKLPVNNEDITSLVINYDVSTSNTSQYNLAISAEFRNSYYGGSASASIDIIIDSAGWSFGTEPQARVTIDGDEYDYYEYDDYWKPLSSHSHYGLPSAFHGRYFVKVVPSQSGALNLHSFLDFLEEKEGAAYMHRIDVISLSQTMRGGGSGSTTVYNYFVELN